MERVRECVDGEIVQDITMNGRELIMRCCAVLEMLSDPGLCDHLLVCP